MIRILVSLLLLAAVARGAGTNSPALAAIAEFRAAGRAWDGEGFARAAAAFARVCAAGPDSATNQYWLATAEFHCALFLLGEPGARTNRAVAAQALSRAAAALQRALQQEPAHAECHALLSTVYGLSIAANPLRAIWLGPRVLKQEKWARQYGPQNPRVLFLAGMNRYYGPAILGGQNEALVLLLAAEERFAAIPNRQADPLEPRWGRSPCLVYIGKIYDARGETGTAARYFHRALAVDPQNKLAQAELEKRTP